MGLFNKTETRSQTITPSAPIMFVPSNGGFTLVTGGEQAVNATPALQSAVATISNDMNAVRYTGGQSKVLNRTNFVDVFRALLIEGNAYMIIQKGQNGIITDLLPVNNQDVTINLDKGHVTYTINNNSGDEAYSSGIYDDSQVLAFVLNRGTNGIERYVGHSPIESLYNALQTSQLAQKQIDTLLKQSIQPKLLLELMSESAPETKKAIKTAFMTANDNDSVIITDSQLSVKKLFTNDSNNDNLINLSKQLSNAVNEVATAFNIPASKVGQAQLDDAQSSSKDIDQRYLDSLVHNYLSVVLNELREKVSDSIGLCLTPLTDFDNSKLIKQTIDLVQAGILPAPEAQAILKNKGVI